MNGLPDSTSILESIVDYELARDSHAIGYIDGLEAAATFLDAQWKRGGVTQEETEALKRLAAGVRALPIKERKP